MSAWPPRLGCGDVPAEALTAAHVAAHGCADAWRGVRLAAGLIAGAEAELRAAAHDGGPADES